MASFSWHIEEEKTIRELERWHKDMVKLQYLVNRGNLADDADSKSFALHIAERMCEDLQQKIHEHKSHLTIIDRNPVSVSDSDTEGIRANKRHMAEEKTIRELERWYKDMVKLQYLVNRGNWADDTVSKPFALYIAERMCEDLLQRIHEHKSHLTIVDHSPVSVSDSDTEGIRANKRQLDEKRMAGSKRAIPQTDQNCKKKQKLEDRIGKINNQRIVPKEKASDDALKWRKYGTKPIRNEIHKKDYYKCASNGCPGKKTVQLVDPELVRIVYYEVHNCGTQDPLVMQQQQQEEIGSDQNAGVLVNEAQPEQHQSPIIPQEMCGDAMSYCQPNDGVLSSDIQVQREQQHDHWLPLSPRIAHSDEIGLELYNAGLVPHLQQPPPSPRPAYTNVPVHIESPSWDLSGLWSDELLNEEGECSRRT